MDDFNDFMDLVDIILIVLVALAGVKKLQKRKGVRELYLDRDATGFFATTFRLIKNNDHEQFRIATRMTPAVFDCLFQLIKDELEKNSEKAIPAECRLFLTLVYLAHGPSRQYISLTFKMSVSIVRRIVLETCEIIWKQLHLIYNGTPNRNEWGKIANDFQNMWDLPHCVGAIDGKHIQITCPHKSGSMYYTYKGTYSIVLLALCDANYTFTAVDVGAFGSQSDGGVFASSELGKRLNNNRLDLPPDAELPNSNVKFPYFIVGDAAFPLKKNLMRPYPGYLLSEMKTNFNARLSRARRVIENTFGILTARWRILRGPLNMSVESAEKIVCAAVVLHNYLKKHDGTYCPQEYVDHEENDCVKEGLWRKEAVPLTRATRFASNNSPQTAFALRDTLATYLLHNKI